MIHKCFRAVQQGSWKKIHDKDPIIANGRMIECIMRNSQRDVFKNYRNDSKLIVIKPPGAGKSTLIKFIHAYDLTKHKDQKLVIAVPQNLIGKTFLQVLLAYDDGSKIPWDVGINLCQDSLSKIDEIVKFLKKDKFVNGIHNRILLCSHTALAMAYARLNDKSVLKNTTIVIDEAHHILYAKNGEVEVSNKIGELVRHILKHTKTNKIWLVTATFIRGDKCSILTPEELELFTEYRLPLDKHWRENIQYIQDYSYDFVIYDNKPWKNIEQIIDDGERKTIVYCPRSNTPLADGCKYTFVKELTKTITKRFRKKYGRDPVIVDLVDESGRDDRKDIVIDEQKAAKIDFIIALDLLNEGVDWPQAEQIIDLAPSNSSRIRPQRFGRLIRDIPGKKYIYYYTFLRFSLIDLDDEKRRRNCSEVFTALTASLLLEDLIQPVQFKNGSSKGNGESCDEYVNHFVLAVPDENKRNDILQSVIEELCVLNTEAKEKNRVLSPSEVEKCIQSVLAENGVTSYVAEITKKIAILLRPVEMKTEKDLEWLVNAGFDKIWRNEALDNLYGLVSKASGVKSWKEFRKIIANGLHNAIKEAHEVFGRAKERGYLPKYNSKNKQEANDYKWIHDKKQIKKGGTRKNGKTRGIWYPILEEIANKYGFFNIFDSISWVEKSFIRATDIFNRAKERGYLPKRSKDKQEAQDASWMSKKRQDKSNGKKWDISLDYVAEQYGFHGAFNLIDLDQEAIIKAENIFNRAKKRGCLPKQHSKDKQEVEDAKWISHRKQAKNGKGHGTVWHPVLEEIAKKHGFLDVFDRIDFKKQEMDKAEEVFGRAKERGNLPKQGSKDEQELKDSQWINDKKLAKIGKGKVSWYSFLDKIATKYGFPHTFDMRDLEQEAIKKAEDIFSRAKQKGHLPSGKSKNEQEKIDGNWIINKRQLKKQCKINGKKWYKELDNVASKYGFVNVFETKNLEQEVINIAEEVFNRAKKRGYLPKQHSSNRQEAKDACWISQKKLSKKGRSSTGVWYPILDKIAARYSFPHAFD